MNQMWFKLLYAPSLVPLRSGRFEACFGWDPQHQKVLEPDSKTYLKSICWKGGRGGRGGDVIMNGFNLRATGLFLQALRPVYDSSLYFPTSHVLQLAVSHSPCLPVPGAHVHDSSQALSQLCCPPSLQLLQSNCPQSSLQEPPKKSHPLLQPAPQFYQINTLADVTSATDRASRYPRICD